MAIGAATDTQYDNDEAAKEAQLLPAIMDECVRKQVPSPACLRKLLQLVKKHVSVQVPIVPTIISLDLLGIRETVLELWILLQKMYPPGGRTT